MPEAFSINREFDFVRLDGLTRATGRPAHEWDLYIVKELIDNALDADEVLWHEDPEQFPRVQIRMEYIPVPASRCRQLFIQVSNRAVFPANQIADIFATQWYTSRKAFIKGLTRGALGNALKTLLGIPYALRARLTGDWSPDLKPMVILCDGKEYLPHYVVDSAAQAIHFGCETKQSRPTEGTVISVGLDHFEQEMPRTLAQVKLLARQYHLCNPHAEFHWAVELEDQDCAIEYAANPQWAGEFQGAVPIQWYSATAFHDLLCALYRRGSGNTESEAVTLEAICQCFAGQGEATKPDRDFIAGIGVLLGRSELTKADLDGPTATRLYQILCQHTSPFDSRRLGCIGPEHVRTVLAEALPIEGNVLYEAVTDAGDDPGVPFVLEAAVARLDPKGQDSRRQMWTAINFAPTYGDPFLSRWLRAPSQPQQPVLGLRGFLDAYGIRDDTPAALFLHLICPTVEHSEFSKTEINHLPFRQALGELLDRLLTALRQAREEEERRLELAVSEALDAIVAELRPNERFVFDQLLEKLRARLRLDPALSTWLETPDAMSRLRAHIAGYQSRKSVLTQHVARPAPGMLAIPSHPDSHFSVRVEDVTRDLLARHHVSKVLYLQVRELEPVVIENGWLCRMDMALLQNPSAVDGLRDAVVQCVANGGLPVLAIHNADEVGRSAIGQMQAWLEERGLDTSKIVDLGLGPVEADDGDLPSRLVEMMPAELASWFIARLATLGVWVKSMPTDARIRQEISDRFEKLLLGHLWEGMSQQIGVMHVVGDIDRQLHYTDQMMAQRLDRQLKALLTQEPCLDSYSMVLDRVVGSFFETFMRENGVSVRTLLQEHLGRAQGGRSDE